jgi:tRNA pseudouridine32 synthase/23S rRNA pseudouridine746 synthase
MTRPARPALPMLNGVSASCVATPPTPRGGAAPWTRMLEFLAQRFPKVSPAAWAERMARGEVLDEAGLPLRPQSPYRGGQRVFYYRWLDDEPPWPFDPDTQLSRQAAPGTAPHGRDLHSSFVERVLWRDDHLLVVDKPHFMSVSPGGRHVQQSLLARLRRTLGLSELTPLHRLDRETAGVMLLSIQPNSRDAFQALFRQRRVFKAYHAVAPWHARHSWPQVVHNRLEESKAFMQMHEARGEPNALTRIQPLQVDERRGLALYALEPLTGKKHQLRAHMAGLGLPIVNDTLYPVLQPPSSQPDFQRPLQLLAHRLAFSCPITGQAREFVSQLQLLWPPAEPPVEGAVGGGYP